MEKKTKLTALEKSWILYDIGNSAFILLVATMAPIFFESLTVAGGVSDHYFTYWSFATAISTAIVAVIAPICGTLADQKGFKKPLFLICMLLGAVGCAALGGPWGWLTFLIIFIIAKVGFSGSLVFYDSMLPEITTAARMDKISAMGYAYGYIGSVIPFLVCLVLVLFSDSFGLSQGTAMIIAFTITALWWILCSIPLARRYRQTAFVKRDGNAVAATFRQLADTFREARKHKHIFLYLLAFFFFINGVYTIIDQATAYGTALGLDSTGLVLALLVTQIVAFPCSILFGRLSAKVDAGLMIKISIGCYTFINIFAIFLQSQWQFWMLAVMVGMFQGGIQALSRSYLGKIIPAEHSGEYYGLMDICGKGASFLGSTMIGLVSSATEGMTFNVFGVALQNESIAVSSLVILFIIGYVLFCKADKLTKQQIAV
jgi:UMF1 family MFS transporter